MDDGTDPRELPTGRPYAYFPTGGGRADPSLISFSVMGTATEDAALQALQLQSAIVGDVCSDD